MSTSKLLVPEPLNTCDVLQEVQLKMGVGFAALS